jgi:transposase
MYRNRVQWAKIRRLVLVEKVPIREVTRKTGISRKTIRKMLACELPKPYGPRSTANPVLAISAARQKVNLTPISEKRAAAKNAAYEWMRSVQQKERNFAHLRSDIGDLAELSELLDRLYKGGLAERNRSMVILAYRHGLKNSLSCRFLGISRKTGRKYLETFASSGLTGLFAHQTKSNRKFDNPSVKSAVFKLLHAPPSNYGINRTTWTMAHLSSILKQSGCHASPKLISTIIKLAGYRWRRARIVLTSKDPDFREKLDRVQSILSALGPDEVLFCGTGGAPSYSAVAEIARMPNPHGCSGVVRKSGSPLF